MAIDNISPNSSYHVEDIVQTAHPLAFLGVKASHSEDDRGICSQLVSSHHCSTFAGIMILAMLASMMSLTNCYSSNPHPFLHDLQPDNQLHPATDVKVARTPPSDHGEI